MEFELRDLLTLIGESVWRASLYVALRGSVHKVAGQVRSIETFHKREIEMINDAIKEQKTELNSKNAKLEGKIDAIQSHIAQISTSLAELNGYLKAK